MGADETFGRDTDDRAVVMRELLRLSAKVTGTDADRRGGRPHRHPEGALRRLHHDHPLPHAAATPPTSPARCTRPRPALFDALGLQRARIRLVGVRVEGLVPRDQVQRQLVLGARDHGWEDADRAVDAAALRFGGGAVRRATLLIGDRP